MHWEERERKVEESIEEKERERERVYNVYSLLTCSSCCCFSCSLGVRELDKTVDPAVTFDADMAAILLETREREEGV